MNLYMPAKFSFKLSSILWLLFFYLFVLNTANAYVCKTGAEVEDQKYCDLFYRYIKREDAHPDPLIEKLIPPVEGNPVPARSFAVFVDINEYPNMPDKFKKLPPAALDRDHILQFLADQGFEEVILIENKNATRNNIDYILEKYLVNQLGTYGPRSRTLFIYSGHGAQGLDPNPGWLVLAEANSFTDYPHFYRLSDLTSSLREVAAASYQFAALLGSCYSGGAFPIGLTGTNSVRPGGPRAHIVTATAADDLAFAVGANNGTLFFDNFIDGIVTGDGDRDYSGWIQKDGALVLEGGGIVGLGNLVNHISANLDKLGTNPLTQRPFPSLLIGSLIPSKPQLGALFFLGPPKRTINAKTTFMSIKRRCRRNGECIDLKNAIHFLEPIISTGSAALGHPEIAVFEPIFKYDIKGIDISPDNREIRWSSVKDNGIRFVYIDADDANKKFREFFDKNWHDSKQVGIIPGAYFTMDFCKSADDQLGNIFELLPNTANDLPTALVLNWVSSRKVECQSQTKIKEQLKAILDGLKRHYQKTPIIQTSADGARDILGDDFQDYPIWLQDFRRAENFDSNKRYEDLGPRLPGENPWTLWQATSTGQIPGITGSVGIDVFFGPEKDFQTFRTEGSNVGLAAVWPN